MVTIDNFHCQGWFKASLDPAQTAQTREQSRRSGVAGRVLRYAAKFLPDLKAMRVNEVRGKRGMGVSSAGVVLRACGLLIACLLVAAPVALLPGSKKFFEPVSPSLMVRHFSIDLWSSCG